MKLQPHNPPADLKGLVLTTFTTRQKGCFNRKFKGLSMPVKREDFLWKPELGIPLNQPSIINGKPTNLPIRIGMNSSPKGIRNQLRPKTNP